MLVNPKIIDKFVNLKDKLWKMMKVNIGLIANINDNYFENERILICSGPSTLKK